MPKSNYRFNPDTLSYDKIELGAKDTFWKILGYIGVSVTIAIAFSFGFIKLFETSKIQALRSENNRLVRQFELANKDIDKLNEVLKDIQYRDDNIYRAIFEADPIESSVRSAGFGGIDRYSDLENMENSELVIATARRLDILSKQMYIQSKSYEEVLDMALSKEKMLISIPSIQPVSNKDLKRTASGWGMRIHPIYKVPKFHYGMDFTAPSGSEIFATGDGKVTKVKKLRTGYGYHVVIDHGFGFETLYAHMSAFNVKRGQKVKRGDVIGYVGSTGRSTGAHVHYEVHRNGKAINPQNYYFQDLSASEYEKMIQVSSSIGQSFD